MQAPQVGKWLALAGLLGLVISIAIPSLGGYLFIISAITLPFGLLEWTYEVSRSRAMRADDGELPEPSRLASVVFVSELVLLGTVALSFSAVGAAALMLGDGTTDTGRSRALWVILAFLLLSLGALALAVRRWAFRDRSAYWIPLFVPAAAYATVVFVNSITGTG